MAWFVRRQKYGEFYSQHQEKEKEPRWCHQHLFWKVERFSTRSGCTTTAMCLLAAACCPRRLLLTGNNWGLHWRLENKCYVNASPKSGKQTSVKYNNMWYVCALKWQTNDETFVIKCVVVQLNHPREIKKKDIIWSPVSRTHWRVRNVTKQTINQALNQDLVPLPESHHIDSHWQCVVH